MGHYNKAIKYLKQAVELNEKDWNAWSWLGMSYFETERHDDAYKCIKRSADHKDSNGLYWMGVLYQEGIGVKKDKIKAIDYFLKAKTAGNEYVDGKLEQMEN